MNLMIRLSRLLLTLSVFLLPTAAEAAEEFIFTWDTSTPNEQLTLTVAPPGFWSSSYNYSVDWGDLYWNLSETGSVTHVYANPGTHTIQLSGSFPYIEIGTDANRYKLRSLEQWGTNNWSSLANLFKNATNLQMNAVDAPQMPSPAFGPNGTFMNVKTMNSSVNHWDVSKVPELNATFSGASSFNQPLDGWDVGNAEFMKNLLVGTALSTENYDKTLIAWSQLPSLKNGVTLDADARYSAAAADARQYIIDTYGWTINDGGHLFCIREVTSTNLNGTFTAGSALGIEIQFCEPVKVTGFPRLALNSKGSTASAYANYVIGDGTNTLTFSYSVLPGHNSSDLDYTSVAALDLNGGDITDASGGPINLDLPIPGKAGSLSKNKDLVIAGGAAPSSSSSSAGSTASSTATTGSGSSSSATSSTSSLSSASAMDLLMTPSQCANQTKPDVSNLSYAAGDMKVNVGGRTVTFTDVTEGAWYANVVAHSTKAGVIAGYRNADGSLNGTFGPADTLTRAQFLKMIAIVADLTIGAETAPDLWYEPYQSAVSLAGSPLAGSYTSTTIHQQITRSEVAQIIVDLWGWSSADTESFFADVTTASDISNTNALREKCIFLGDDSTENADGKRTLRPQSSLLRAEGAALASRLLSVVK